MRTRFSLLHLLLVSGAIFLWASAFVVNRYLNAHIDPYIIVCLRLLLAGMIMLPYLFLIKFRLGDFVDIALGLLANPGIDFIEASGKELSIVLLTNDGLI